MTNQIQSVSFHNQQITVLNHDNKPYVAMKSIVENIGLNWHAQLNRINRHHVLSKGVVMIATPTKGGVQEYACLPISMINGWLFGIETGRVKPEIRSTLEQYQLECFDVLYNHFMPKVAQQYPNTISAEQQQMIKQAVNERAYRTGEKHQGIYQKLYAQFKIPKYQDLPASKFNDAVKWLSGEIKHGTVLDDKQLYHVWYLLNRFNHLHEIFKKYDLYHNLTGLGSRAGIEMRGHFDDGSSVNIYLKDLFPAFEVVQKRLGLNQYRKQLPF